MVDYVLENLGFWLCLPYSKTNEVKRNFHCPSQRREAYFDLYATDHPCPSWSQVAEALRNGAGLYNQADMVENTYVQGKISTSLHTCSMCTEGYSIIDLKFSASNYPVHVRKG